MPPLPPRPLFRLTRLPPGRAYHSYQHAQPSTPYTATETSILSAGLAHVPTHGFTINSLARGARDVGALDITTNLFPRGAFELIRYHLITQRTGLASVVVAAARPDENAGTGRKIRELCVARLKGNEAVIHQWQEALAVMSLVENVPASVAELAKLADEMWFLAGDKAVDTSWYTKRAMLGGVYASTEVFMTTDESEGFEETWEFLDRRLEDTKRIGVGAAELGEYLGFTARATGNILRSKGLRWF